MTVDDLQHGPRPKGTIRDAFELQASGADAADIDSLLDLHLSTLPGELSDDDRLAMATLYASGERAVEHALPLVDNAPARHDDLYLIARRHSSSTLLVRLADKGHVESMLLLSTMSDDQSEALKWIQSAADAGHLQSQLALSALYASTQPESSFRYSLMAAKSGDRIGQYQAGRCLLLGRGCPQDVPGAMDLLQSSSDQGLPDAMLLLGGIHVQGMPGVPVDKERALRCFRAAADAGLREAQYITGSLLIQEKAEVDGLAYMHKAAHGGHARAQLDLGKMYNSGEAGLRKDPGTGFMWCLRAARFADENDNGTASFIVAIMYLEGIGTEQNILAGCHYLRQAIQQGHPKAQGILDQILSDTRLQDALEQWDLSRSLIRVMAPSSSLVIH